MSFDLRCEFCGESACLDKCDWPVMDFVPMRVRDLEVGDTVRRFNDLHAKPSVARVVELQEFADCSRKIVLEISGKRKYPMRVFTATAYAAIRIKRDTKCERVCCELHRCERGPGGTYCMDHWHTPESREPAVAEPRCSGLPK